ncbi:MAG: hypothetical protein ACI8UO_000083 [Verrucomicrobiales bacterium]|jgi:hypothetical protein
MITVKKIQDPDFLVAQIEEHFNCRAEIETVKLDIFARPARLQVTGIAIGPRDAVVEKGVPLRDRKALNNTIYIQHIDLMVETLPLFQRKLVVRNLEIESPRVTLEIYEDGKTSLDELLRKPGKSEEKPDETKIPAAATAKASPGFTVDDLSISAIAKRFAIEDMEVLATIEKTGTVIQIFDSEIIATNVDIDPENLASHNSIDLDYHAHIAVDSTAQGQRFIDLDFDGKGVLRPFDPKTRELRPFLDTTVGASQDSYIDGLVILDELEGVIGELEAFDIHLGDDLRLRGDFTTETKDKIRFTVHRGRFELMPGTKTDPNDFEIPIDGNLLILEEGSWIDSATDQHEFNVVFFLSKSLTDKVKLQLDEFLEDVPEVLAKELKKVILEPALLGDNIMIKLTSSGSIGDPLIALHTKFGSIDSKGGGLESLIRGALKGGDDDDDGDKPDPLKEIEGELENLLKELRGGGDDE